jgi:hypothetical protein
VHHVQLASGFQTAIESDRYLYLASSGDFGNNLRTTAFLIEMASGSLKISSALPAASGDNQPSFNRQYL